jgi:hypothetical protein
MKFYKKSDSVNMPWKNGHGTTEQIEIFPENSSFPEGEDFLWRISSAKVQGATPFSQFPGCDRWLTVLRGQGLLLDGGPLLPDEPIHFSGETPLHCALLGGEVTDLGIIYRRDKIRAEMFVNEFPEDQQLDLPKGIHFIYCSDESLKVTDHVLEAGDSLRIEGPAKIMIQSSFGGKFKYIHILIQEKLD